MMASLMQCALIGTCFVLNSMFLHGCSSDALTETPSNEDATNATTPHEAPPTQQTPSTPKPTDATSESTNPHETPPPQQTPSTPKPTDATSESINECVLKWSIDHLDKKVWRGECTDLPYKAVLACRGEDKPKKEWPYLRTEAPFKDHPYVWSLVEVSVDNAQPGDILQMFNQKFKKARTGPQHTAVVKENLGQKKIKVLQSNFWGGTFISQKVHEYEFDFSEAKSGLSIFYRPQREY